MSKLYSKYLSLKKETNSSKIYLFKSGIFFLFIDEDAKMMSQLLQLKPTNLNPTVLKCGFPVNSLEKYMPLLEQTGKTIEIIDLEKNSSSSPKKFTITKDVKDFITNIEEHINKNLCKLEKIKKIKNFLKTLKLGKNMLKKKLIKWKKVNLLKMKFIIGS